MVSLNFNFFLLYQNAEFVRNSVKSDTFRDMIRRVSGMAGFNARKPKAKVEGRKSMTSCSAAAIKPPYHASEGLNGITKRCACAMAFPGLGTQSIDDAVNVSSNF